MRIILFLCIAMFLVSCQKKIELKDFSPKYIVHISYNKQKEQAKKMLSKIEEINLIPLKFDSTFILTGNATQMRITSTHIYMLDQRFKKFFGFSISGDNYFKIDRFGRGPGEFLRPENFFISNNDNINIFDKGTGKILVYHKDGRYIKEYRIYGNVDNKAAYHKKADNITSMDNSSWIFYNQNPSRLNQSRCIIRVDTMGKEISSSLSLPKWIRNSTISLVTGSNFSYIDSTPLLILPWCNYIFEVALDKVSCRFYVDFGKYNIPESFLVEHESEIDKDYLAIIKEVLNREWGCNIDFFQESSGFASFTFLRGKNLYFTLFDKKISAANTVRLIDFPTEWYLVMKPFLCSYQNTFYTTVPISELDLLLKIPKPTDPRILKIREQYIEFKKNIGRQLNGEDQVLLSFKMKD